MISPPQYGVYAKYTHGKSFDLWANWEMNIHTYIHTYINTYIHTYIHTYITYIHTYIHYTC